MPELASDALTSGQRKGLDAYREKLRARQPVDPVIAEDAFTSPVNEATVWDERAKRVTGQSMDKDADTMAEVQRISEGQRVSTAIVEDNLEDFKKQERLEQLSHLKNPALIRFLANQGNADVAHDDIDTLQGIEDHLGAFNAGVLSFPEMTLGGTGTLIEVGGRTVERILPESLVQAIREFDKDIPAPSRLFTRGGELAGELGEYLAPEEETFTTQVAGGLGQVGAQIATMLVAPQAAVPSLFATGVEQQAERQRATGTYGGGIEADAALLAGGTTTAAIEKVGLDKLLNRVPPEIQNRVMQKLADVAIGGGYEAVTEVAEGIGHGLIEYMTTNPNAEIFQGVKEEATVAGTVGAIVRALIPSYRGTARTKQTVDAVDESLKHLSEQEFIDQSIVLAQQSKTSERSARAFKEFVDGLPEKTEFHVDPQAFAEYTGPLPEYISDQIDGLGSDISLTYDQLAQDVVNNPELMSAVRPHMRMTEDSLSQSEFEAEAGAAETVKNLLESAQEEIELKTESEEIFDEVVEQLVATGRLSERNARISAATIPAYVVTAAKARGISVKEIYDMMGLKIGKLEPDFKGEMTEQEFTIEDTGQKVKVREQKQAVYDRAVKRRDMAEKLRDCLDG